MPYITFQGSFFVFTLTHPKTLVYRVSWSAFQYLWLASLYFLQLNWGNEMIILTFALTVIFVRWQCQTSYLIPASKLNIIYIVRTHTIFQYNIVWIWYLYYKKILQYQELASDLNWFQSNTSEHFPNEIVHRAWQCNCAIKLIFNFYTLKFVPHLKVCHLILVFILYFHVSSKSKQRNILL